MKEHTETGGNRKEQWKKKKEVGRRARNGSWDFVALAFYTHSRLRLVPEILRLLWTIPVTMGGQGGRDKHRDFSIYQFPETFRIGTLLNFIFAIRISTHMSF